MLNNYSLFRYPSYFDTLRKVRGEDPTVMTKSTFAITALAALFTCLGLAAPCQLTAQDNILGEMYGRGVHAYYAGNYIDAESYLTTAIENGIDDPRAYYFRGILENAQGRTAEAETDWAEGAKMEASGTTNVDVGRSLSRFQGSARLKLEEIRRLARLQALTGAPTRSQIRMNEIKAAVPPAKSTVAAPPVPRSSRPVAAPPTPPAADNPFANDTGLAAGQPQVEQDDALAGAMNNPFKDDAAAAPAAAGGADVFGGADAAAGADPFGAAAPAAGGDPFGAPAPAAGGDPFGAPAGGGAMDDPFADDPFK